MTKYNFQQISVQGDTGGTVASGINDEGQISGWSVPGGYNIYPHSFVDTNGSMVPLTSSSPVFMSGQAAAAGINNEGQISGTQGSSPVGIRAFLWAPDKTAQTFSSVPTATYGTLSHGGGVNDLGQVVGSNDAFNGFNGHNSFLWQAGKMSFLQYPGATFTDARGISDDGTIVGYYSAARLPNGSSAPNHPFVDTNGHMTAIMVPGAVSAEANAISPDGRQIVGTYQDSAGHNHGWIDRAGRIQTLDMPGATDTSLLGLNDFKQIVGSYVTAGDPVQHGFVATPDTEDLHGGPQALPGIVRQHTGLSQGALFYDPSHPVMSGMVTS